MLKAKVLEIESLAVVASSHIDVSPREIGARSKGLLPLIICISKQCQPGEVAKGKGKRVLAGNITGHLNLPVGTFKNSESHNATGREVVKGFWDIRRAGILCSYSDSGLILTEDVLHD